MAEIKVPIQINLPDDWIEQIVNRLKNDPEAEWVEIVRCKDCEYMTEYYDTDGNALYWTCSEWDSETDYDGFCHYAKRKE